jgi:Icc-related predicted phosphoesterase
VLDGTSCEIRGLGFAGVKGFGGGFHGKILVAWGEPAIKQFVHEAVNEARKLDAALAQLTTAQKVVLLHYAPIRATVINESPEIYAFCGSSHLEAPLNRYQVAAAFHGHAHHGTVEGRTRTGVPVYNVSEPLLRHVQPGRPFALVSIPLMPAAASGQAVEASAGSQAMSSQSP